jgi:hypothetical protein
MGIRVRIRQVAKIPVEVARLELGIVTALAERLAQIDAGFALRGALVRRFVEAVLEIGEALGAVMAVGFVDADAEADPVVVQRLVAAGARDAAAVAVQNLPCAMSSLTVVRLPQRGERLLRRQRWKHETELTHGSLLRGDQTWRLDVTGACDQSPW